MNSQSNASQSYSQQQAPQQSYAAPQAQQGTRQPLDKGQISVAVGTYQSKEFMPDGRTPKIKTEFLPCGRYTDWGDSIQMEVYLNGKKENLTIFKNTNQL